MKFVIDTWDAKAGETRYGRALHNSKSMVGMPEWRGWYLTREVHDWFVANEIDYVLDATWRVERSRIETNTVSEFCIYVIIPDEDQGILAMLKWEGNPADRIETEKW